MSENIKTILARVASLKDGRAELETEWQEYADTYVPGTQSFTSSSKPWKPISAIAAYGKDAAQTLTSQLFSGLVSPGTKWFHFVPEDSKTVLDKQAQTYLETLSQRVLNVFAGTGSNFSGQIHEALMSMVVFGPSSIFVENNFGTDISFHSLPLSQIYIGENNKHQIDSIVRCFKFTAKQAVQAWGKKVHAKILKAYHDNPEEVFEFVQCSWENKKSKSNKDKYVSYYVDIANQHIIQTRYKAYFEFVTARWAKFAGELYGHGQGKLAQTVMRGITHIRLENLKSLEFANNPVMFTADDGVLIPETIRPGSQVPGAISSMDGQRRIEMWTPGANNQAGIQMFQQEIGLLQSLFFLDKIALPRDATRRTAFETAAIQQEQIRFLAPFISRIENELLKPLTEVVMTMLTENGEFEDAPESIKDMDLKVEFLSPLARLMKMEDVRAEQQFLQTVLPVLQFDPNQAAKIRFEKVIEDAQKGTGAPADILRSDEEMQAIAQQQQAQAQQQNQMQNALQASEITKNLGGLDDQ